MAQSGYGSYKYESPEARALGTITSESYDKDQAKNLIKLNNDVSYMAAYMRKMQKGIDDANQNVIQQIQSFINDIIVLIGGGSAQGFDFGDLRYILQMIGALLGIGEQDFPLSAFESAWHMLSTYIFPSAQFEDVINALIDSAIGGILDLFGEVPIAGEALQQLAAVILSVRDFFSSFDLSHLVISISQLADQSPTVIWEGGFDAATTIPEGFGFTWDGAGGETSPFGSAMATGDSTEKAIFSNIFEVAPKQVLNFRTAAWYQGASNSGSDAVVIELVPYDQNNVVGAPVKIAGITPSGNSSGWVVMQGNYTIPNSGWSKAVARIRVTNKLTAGTIKFDNAKVTRTQKILQEWVDGLAQALADIVDWIENLVDELLDAIGLGGGLGGLFDKIQDLATGIGEWLLDTEDVSAGFSNLVDDLLTAPATVIGVVEDLIVEGANTIGDFFADLDDAVGDVFDDVRDGWTRFWGKVFNVPSPPTQNALGFEEATDEVIGRIQATQSATDNLQLSQGTLQSTILLPRKQPLWVSKWPDDDVSFPVALIDSVINPGLNVLLLSPITATADRIYQSVKFGLGSNTMTSCYVGIYLINKENGEFNKIRDLGNVKSLLSSGYNQQSLELPSPLSVAKGDNLCVGILQVGGTSSNFYRDSNDTVLSDYPTSYPQFLGARHASSQSSLPNTITDGNVVFGPRIWAALGYGVAPPPPPLQSYLEPFTYTSGTQLENTPNWGLIAGSPDPNNRPKVTSNRLVPPAAGFGYYQYVHQLTTYQQYAAVDMVYSRANGFGILLRLSPSGSAVMAHTVQSGNTVRIATTTNIFSAGINGAGWTQRASVGVDYNVNDHKLIFMANGNEYVAQVIRTSNGSVTAQTTWTDSGSVHNYVGGKYGGIHSGSGDSGDDRLDNFVLQDID